jgi:hypothetical protein
VCVFKLDPFVTVVGVAAAAASCALPEGSVEQCAVMRYEQHPFVPPEEEIVWFKVTGTRWPSDRAASCSQFLQKLSIQEVPPVLQCV